MSEPKRLHGLLRAALCAVVVLTVTSARSRAQGDEDFFMGLGLEDPPAEPTAAAEPDPPGDPLGGDGLNPGAPPPPTPAPAGTGVVDRLPGADPGAPVVDAPPADEAPEYASPAEVDADERVRRAEELLLAKGLVVKALEAWQKGDFETAYDHYEEAEKRLTPLSKIDPEVLNTRKRVNEAMAAVQAEWAQAVADEAQRSAVSEDFGTAIRLAEKAMERDPSLADELEARIHEYKVLQVRTAYEAARLPRNVDPDRFERDMTINLALEQGKVFLANHRYADAREKFEEVLSKDPYEVRAMRLLRVINKRIDKVARDRRVATASERLAEVSWKWNEPVTPLLGRAVDRAEGGPVLKLPGDSKLQQKLQQIRFPSIDFQEAPITTVVEYFKRMSVDLDEDGEGINILLYLTPPGGLASAPATPAPAAPAPAEEFPFDDMGGGGFFDEPAAPAQPATPAALGGDVAVPKITINMNDIPLGDAIRFVCLAAGLKFRIDTNAVIIAHPDVPIDKMLTRTYNVEAASLDVNVEGIPGGGGGGGGDDFGGFDAPAATAGGGGLSPETLKGLFANLGVEFPAGASIMFLPSTSLLVVKNTPENLRQLEEVLRDLRQTPPLVTIESKFVEISQSDLQELGFSWLLEEGDGYYTDGIVLGNGSSRYGMQILKQGGPAGTKTAPKLSNALRFGNNVLDSVAEGADQLLSVNSVIGGVSFNTIVHALDQKTNADVLSAPKVTTVNGQAAILKMVEKRHIATGWTEPDIVGGGDDSDRSFTPSIAETEEQEFGVILDVTPNVAPDQYTIRLVLYPRVVSFVDYDDRFNYTMIVDGEEVEAKQLTPITAERSVQTEVIVYDGETVVLGGMMGERIKSWEDKTPFLGDIPMLGKLFQSSGETSDKTNLLIFVTARIVDPSGLPKRSGDVRGLPDFGR